jgi:hypothetical protein
VGNNPNSFQKRQRELDKKRKAEDKRKRRLAQKQSTATQDSRPETGAGGTPASEK